jgi:Domain of unknown function (DUF5666)
MKKPILKITAAYVFAATLATLPANVRAQDAMSTNAPAVMDQTFNQTSVQTTNAPVKKHVKKHDRSMFNGKLTAVDTNAMTLTVGERTFEISSETIITKAGEPATLSEGVVGETASVAFKKDADGKLTATSIHFGTKAEGEKKKKKKANPDSTGSTTNSVPN